MVSIFADQDVGDGALGRKATLDQGRRGRSLFHTVGAGAAGILGTDGHDHTQLRRHDVQPLGTVFADLVHLPAAAGAHEHLGLDDLLDPRQVRGQVATVAPGQPFAFRRVIAGRLILFLFLGLGDSDLQVLESQLPLVLVELLGLLAMHDMVQFGHQVLEALVDFLEAGRLAHQRGDSVALVLGNGRKVDIRQGRHVPNIPRTGWKCALNQSPDSFCRSRPARLQRLHPAPVQAREKGFELRPVQRNEAVLDRRPGEGRLLQPLVGHHQSGPVPEQDLQPVGPLGAEHEHSAGERIFLQRRLHQSGQPVMAFPEVHGLRRHQDAHPVRRHDHVRHPTARTISAIRAAEVPASRRIVTSPTAISIKGAPAVDVASGEASGCPSSHSTSGANPGGHSDAGRTSLPSLARRRHSESRFARSPWRAATLRTVAPGSSVSATICALSPSGHRRRPATELSAPLKRKNSCVSSTEKLLPYSKTETDSQKSYARKRWAPDRAHSRFWEKKRQKHLLTGLLRCGCCGGGFAAVGRDYVACSAARKLGTCAQKKSFKRRDLDCAVLDLLKDRLMQPDAVAEFVAVFTKEANGQRDTQAADRKRAQKDRDTLAKKLDGLYDAVANGLRTRGLLERLEGMEAELKALDAELAAPAPSPVRLHPNLAEQYRHKVADLAATLTDPELRAPALEILRGLIERVIVTVDDEGHVSLELFGAITAIIKTAQPGALVGEMTDAQFQAFLRGFIRESAAMVMEGGICMICMDWRHVADLVLAGKAEGLSLLNMCVWNKTNGGMGSLYRSKHELICVFRKPGAPHINNVELGKHGRNRTNVWDYAGVNSFGKGREADLADHPTVKPTALVADAIMDVTHRGDIVLDCFGGSGSTLLAAEKTGRKARLIELDPLYVDVAIRRWQEMTGQKAVHAVTGETFEERVTAVETASTTEASHVDA